ncbi:MAG: putative zinc metalloprotease [candidate division WS2 bacterium ADurb.Bin280]|uniref:Putative zinc metalloprotease n=1 Tax=candidate division WS2 bacterium ADurb.Bin280 TaxID=1852829 RepID=A0A1V5SBP5_9BACT|nr:MAG: putative zinc metalloprotease [candidate division WS2 bacterium ADurb.Bin280]
MGIVDIANVKLPFFSAIAAGFKEMVLTTGYIFMLIINLFVALFTAGNVSESVAGPVKIFNVTGDALKMGWGYLVQFAALLSINVALVNILPFPALDGGRAILILLEGIFRRRVIKEDFENLLHTIGFVILIGLIAIITFKEIIALL